MVTATCGGGGSCQYWVCIEFASALGKIKSNTAVASNLKWKQNLLEIVSNRRGEKELTFQVLMNDIYLFLSSKTTCPAE